MEKDAWLNLEWKFRSAHRTGECCKVTWQRTWTEGEENTGPLMQSTTGCNELFIAGMNIPVLLMNEDGCKGAVFLKASPNFAHQVSPSHTYNFN